MSGAISAINLSKRFRRMEVLNSIDMDVPEGSVFGLIGPNGAGKTTTIKILMNILKPTSGNAQVLGMDSRELTAGAFTQIGYVSENQDMPDWMTVAYFLSYLKPFYPSWDESRVDDLVRRFNLPTGQKLKHLSRGMRMKASLVSSLAYRPRLLVLDEPFSGLDPLVRDDLVQGLLDIAGETTILISSHDLAEIETFASHIAYLDSGRLQFSEDMPSLTNRFREVEVVVDAPMVLPPKPEWPSTWLMPEATQAVIRFVETRFEPERTTQEVRRLFKTALQISINPMSLRAIFLTLARSSSKAA